MVVIATDSGMPSGIYPSEKPPSEKPPSEKPPAGDLTERRGFR